MVIPKCGCTKQESFEIHNTKTDKAKRREIKPHKLRISIPHSGTSSRSMRPRKSAKI